MVWPASCVATIPYVRSNCRAGLRITIFITHIGLKDTLKHIIEKIRREVIELERHNWKIKFNWIKAHAGHQENEMADELAKEAATNSDIKECYVRIPKSEVKSELSENSETKWQIEWDRTTKGVTMKLYFPKVADRLKLKINVSPNLTTMVTGHGNIK